MKSEIFLGAIGIVLMIAGITPLFLIAVLLFVIDFTTDSESWLLYLILLYKIYAVSIWMSVLGAIMYMLLNHEQRKKRVR